MNDIVVAFMNKNILDELKRRYSKIELITIDGSCDKNESINYELKFDPSVRMRASYNGMLGLSKQETLLLLNEREIQALRLICEGFTNEEIAKKMYKSIRTVEGYRLRIFNKLKVKNTAAMVSWAFRNGLIS